MAIYPKQPYEKPTAEVMLFAERDILTTSDVEVTVDRTKQTQLSPWIKVKE